MSLIRVRPEVNEDAAAIEVVTTAAFRNAAHSNHTEQFIIRALRKTNELSLSLVAEEANTIVGHVAVSPVKISDGSADWYGIGPISVLPDHQRRGIGSLLMKRALRELQAYNAAGCVVLGDPGYYNRFGFKAELSLQLPGIQSEYFMAITFHGSVPSGTVAYSKVFEAEE